jgi:hypothetical protein
MDGQAALIGGGMVVGGVYGGAGVITLAERIRSSGFQKMAADLDARGAMPAEDFLARTARYDRNVKAPTNLLRNVGLTMVIGGIFVGGAVLGAALLGDD